MSPTPSDARCAQCGHQPCDPVRRDDGKCIVSTRMASALVDFADGSRRVVKRRRLRVVATSCALPHDSTVGAATPATDAAADVPHETPDLQP